MNGFCGNKKVLNIVVEIKSDRLLSKRVSDSFLPYAKGWVLQVDRSIGFLLLSARWESNRIQLGTNKPQNLVQSAHFGHLGIFKLVFKFSIR